MLINDEGYPFKWDVFPGNTAEVKTLKQNINACKTRFGLNNKNVTLVFDRGIISDENAVIKRITVQNKLKGGSVKSINSFQVQIESKPNVIKADKLIDDLSVFVTNHTEKQGVDFRVKPQSI